MTDGGPAERNTAAAGEDDPRYRATLLSALMEASPNGVLAVSPGRKVLGFNRRFLQLWHLPEGSVRVGGESPALMPECLDQVVDVQAFTDGIRWGHTHPTEHQTLLVPLKDGRILQGESGPVLAPDGTYLGRVWSLRDDSEQLAADAERAELLTQLQAAQKAQTFLLEASAVLTAASGYRETLDRLAGVAVPALGDVCYIDVVDDEGELARVVARHVNAEMQDVAAQLGREYPPGADHPSSDAIRTGRSMLVSELSTELRDGLARDERHRQLIRALGVTSYMIVPLITGGSALGAVTLAVTTSERRFGPGDLALAEDLAARVAQVVAKERRYEEEHELAHTLQTSLLPERLPVVAGLNVAVRYLPGTRGADVGGDWYDMVVLADGRVGVAVGDVAGHNIAAASAMGRIRSATRALARHATGPAGLLDLLQDSWRLLDVDRLTTLVLAHVDVATGELRIASAGHPPPLLARASGSSYLPVEAAPPLGAPRRPIAEYVTWLQPGETLLLYTDGLIETRHGGVEGGMVGVAERAAHGSLDPSALCDRLIEAFPRGPERADDVAMLALSRTSPTGGTNGE